jgi:DNA polymerase
MSERDDLLRNLRNLVELDRGFGVEFVPRIEGAPAPTPATPVLSPRVGAPAPQPARPLVPPAAPVLPPATPSPDLAPRASRLAPSPPASAPPVTPPSTQAATDPLAEAPASLPALAARIAACTRCGLCSTRTRTVPGEGAPRAALLFVGEGPGADEDASGRPFVGAAGQLLTKMIEAMGLAREEVFIANVLKCRPPGNRTPAPEEVAACMPYLREQIAAIRPSVICTLGNTPLRALLGDDTLGITRLRGQRQSFAGIPLIPTFHPSYLLRNPAGKKPCWEDLQLVLKELGRTPPARGGTTTA